MRRLSLLIFLFIFTLSASAQTKIMTVLVQPFSNDGTSQYSWLSAGMTNTVISDLGVFPSIRVITDSDRKSALNELSLPQTGLIDESSMKKVGKMLGADLILTGNYMVSAQKIRVNARIVNVETGHIEKTLKIDGLVDSIFDVQDKIVLGLMENAGKIKLEGVITPKTDDLGKQKLAAKQRPVLSAYELYSKGLEIEYTDPSGAFALFKQAVEQDAEYADALIQAGFISGSMYNRFDEGLGYLSRAEKIMKKRGETKGQYYADLMTYIGIVYSGKGNNTSALEYYNASKTIYEKIGLQKTGGYSALLQNIGNVYQDLYDYDKALDYSLQAKGIADIIGQQDTNNYASILQCIGIAYQSKKSYDKALEYYAKSGEVYESLGLGKTTNNAMLYNNIGNVYYGQNNLSQAIENYDKAKSIYESLGQQNTVAYGHLMYGFALTWEKKGNKAKAAVLFRTAYRSYEASGYEGDWKEKARQNAEEDEK